MKSSLLARVSLKLFAVAACFYVHSTASAQQANSVVAFEGMVSYQSTGLVTQLRTTGAASKLGNFSYDEEFYNARVILVFSNAPFRPGKNVVGPSGASSVTIPVLEPRTYYNNISYSGAVKLQRGKRYSVVLLAIDGRNIILAAHNFSKKLTTRTAKRGIDIGKARLKKALGWERYSAK